MNMRRRIWLAYHLEYNHYPPCRASDECLNLSEAAIDADDRTEPLLGTSYTAAEIIEALHLDTFLEES